MQKIFIVLLMTLIFVGCDSSQKFASTEEEVKDFTSELPSLVEEKEEEKIGRRKNKKGEEVKAELGEKDLRPVAQVDVEVSQIVQPKADPADILFYVSGRYGVGDCWTDFGKSAKEVGFTYHLDSLDWKVGLSLFAKKAKLSVLEKQGREFKEKKNSYSREPAYFLSKSKHGVSDKIFSASLTPREYGAYKTGKDNNNYHYDAPYVSKETLPVEDVISGLDHLLTTEADHFRKDAELYVVMIDHDHFPYYTKKEWKKFYKKYPNLNIIVLSSRRANVSNFSHILNNKKFKFDWMPMCGQKEVAQTLADAIASN